MKLVGPAVIYSESDVKIRSPPPLLGEHTDVVLHDAGFTSAEVATFRAQKVI